MFKYGAHPDTDPDVKVDIEDAKGLIMFLEVMIEDLFTRPYKFTKLAEKHAPKKKSAKSLKK